MQPFNVFSVKQVSEVRMPGAQKQGSHHEAGTARITRGGFLAVHCFFVLDAI